MFMGRIIAKIQRASSGKVVVMFFGPAMLIYFIMLLYTIPLVESYVPGMKLFDLSPAGYTIEYSLQLLGTLGDIGRDKYLHLQLPLDFVYPGLFAVSCSLLLSWLLKKSVSTNSNAFYLCFTPVTAGLFASTVCLQAVSVVASTPARPLIIKRAVSATLNAAMVSPTKSEKPGVSMILTFVLS